MNSSSNESLSDILDRLNKEQAIIMLPSTILVIITMLVGIIGNTLTCYVYSFRLTMTPTYFFVVMLAIVDLITCVIITPGRIIQNVLPLKTTWDGMCANHMVLSVFTGFATSGFLLAIAIDRYRKLCCPLKTQISMRGAKIITVIICLLCAIQGGCAPLYYGSVRIPTTISNVFGHSCSAKITKKVNYYQLVFMAFYLLLIIVTIILATAIHSFILHTMRKVVKTDIVAGTQPQEQKESDNSNNVLLQVNSKTTTITSCNDAIIEIDEATTSGQQSPRASSTRSAAGSYSGAPKNETIIKEKIRKQSLKSVEENLKRLNQTTVTMMMITCVFVITYIPSLSTVIMNSVGIAEPNMGTVAAVFYWLARHTFYISSCLNPVIYGYRNPNFMDEVKLLFKKFK